MNRPEGFRPTVSGFDEPRTSSNAPDERALALARRRSPKFFVADCWAEVLVCSPDLDRSVLERSRRKLEEILHRGQSLTDTAFEQLDAHTLLRLVPLARGAAYYYAVFVEPVKRDGVASAVKRFGVSKREAEVLEGLMAGWSSATIAARLFISEATVGEHVKNLFKKTKTNKRSELVACIFRDAASEQEKRAAAVLKGEEASGPRP